jgi:putative SOS response-associated peptidase YedK
MCFHSKQSKSAQTIEARFKATFEQSNSFVPGIYNGFSFPKTPIITTEKTAIIQMYHWGLLPYWTIDVAFRKNTLNAKIETIHEKPSFRDYVQNRCLVLIDGFYEWQWLDEKGKEKQKYLLTMPNEEPFALAGIWNDWVDKSTGELIKTYTILTTEANELMSKIHNTKKRMPCILSKEDEETWLNEGATRTSNGNQLIAIPL